MCCHEHIYAVPYPCVVLVFNIILPGFGTAIQAYYAKDGCSCGTYMVGVAQSLTAYLIVGWVWSIWHGIQVDKVSNLQRQSQALANDQNGYQPASTDYQPAPAGNVYN